MIYTHAQVECLFVVQRRLNICLRQSKNCDTLMSRSHLLFYKLILKPHTKKVDRGLLIYYTVLVTVYCFNF